MELEQQATRWRGMKQERQKEMWQAGALQNKQRKRRRQQDRLQQLHCMALMKKREILQFALMLM